WTAPQPGLSVTCEVVRFQDFPAVEWTLFLKNTDAADSEVIADIQPLDLRLAKTQDPEFVLHYNRGSATEKADFAPLEQRLGPYAETPLACVGGRSSDGTLPFFRLDYDGAGVLFGIGWSGGWAATFTRDAENGLHVRAGMKQTRFVLHPGEEVRTPRILLVFSGEATAAGRQNQFRKFILAHHTPRHNGQPVQLPLAANSWFIHNWGNGVTEENQKAFITHFVEAGIPLECYWLDAGWYEGVGTWAFDVGNWFPKKTAFPNGLRPLGDEAKRQGMWWQTADTPDRQGITEIRYVTGLYAFWDALLQRHPGLVIDNCASGGRRLDLETVSRSVALWRSDYAFEPDGVQGHTLGLLPWLPCCSAAGNTTDPYTFRSSLAAGMCLCWELEKPEFDVAAARQRVAEFLQLRPLFYGDFYPLTEPSPNSDVWCAWQLDRPDLNRGAVLAFRRPNSPHATGTFRLHGLKPEAQYHVHDVDAGRRRTLTGATLMDAGLDVQIAVRPGSALFLYETEPR
ncbi:MAG: alpha-galactosidase, partial [Lentisphaeria bacterium]